MVITQEAMGVEPPTAYPVRLWMEYPQNLSRLSTFFRIILVIPLVLFIALLEPGSFNFSSPDGEEFRNGGSAAGVAGGGIVVAIWATIIVRQRIPRWLFNFQVGLHRFSNRAVAYFGLLTDKYPAFEGDWALQYEVDYPEKLSRWRVFFWKLITSIPHFIILIFLYIAALVVTVIAWFAILFTGSYPRGLHRFVVGVMRWSARVTAYTESLTDEFPPYSLDHEAGPGSRASVVVSAIIGSLVLAIGIAVVATAVTIFLILTTGTKTVRVEYDDVVGGTASSRSVKMDDIEFTLRSASDPAVEDILAPRLGKRLVAFSIAYTNDKGPAARRIGTGLANVGEIDRDSVRLETDDGVEKPILLTLDGVAAPLRVDGQASGELVAYFEIEADAEVEELRAYPDPDVGRHVRWVFE
jgi:hypothetical protein